MAFFRCFLQTAFHKMKTWLRRSVGPGWALALLALLAVSCHTPAPAQRDPGTPTRIALVSDLHVQNPALSTNAEVKLYSVRLAKTIEAVNAAEVDCVVIAGDLTEHGSNWELGEFRRQTKSFAAPVWFIPGNHDIGNKKIPGKKGAKAEVNWGRLRDYELETGRSWWVHEVAGVRLIGLNSALYGSKMSEEKKMWDFLETELGQTNQPATLLVQHHPPFLTNVTEKGGDYFNMEPYPRARLLALARQAGVKAILSGHLHRALSNSVDGLLLYTTPPVSFSLAKGKRSEGWTLVTVTKDEVKTEFQPLPKIEPAKPANSAEDTPSAKKTP